MGSKRRYQRSWSLQDIQPRTQISDRTRRGVAPLSADCLLAEAWRSVENRLVGAALFVESSLTDRIALWRKF